MKPIQNRLLFTTLLFLFYLAVAAGFQILAGAPDSEFGGYPDESAQYVTGMMVHDYVAQGLPAGPMRYAENYYLHYPQVAFGHWPPIFFLMEAVWAFLFGSSRYSLLLLSACVAAAIAVLLHREIQSRFPLLLAFTGGVLFLSLSLVQRHASMVMADLPLTLFFVVSLLLLIRSFENDTWEAAAWFGFAASVAIMTKPSGLALAFVPPLVIVLTGQYDRLKTARFWVPALIVVALCGPFYFWSWDMQRAGSRSFPVVGERFVREMFHYSKFWLRILGPVLLVAGIVGILVLVAVPLVRGKLDIGWAVFGSSLVAVQIFHCFAPASCEPRRLLTAVPAAILFIAGGLWWISRRSWLRTVPQPWRLPLATLTALCLFCVQTFSLHHPPYRGFSVVVRKLLARPDLQRAVFLISSNRKAGGAFIAEVASQESRPSHVIVRADKYLSSSTWRGRDNRVFYSTPAQVMRALRRIPVRVLVIHSVPGVPNPPDQDLLLAMVKKYPERWKGILTVPNERAPRPTKRGGTITVYEWIGKPGSSRLRLEIDMGDKLNKILRLDQ